MINKYIIGRLGNQMFQYATVRAFQIKNNLEKEEINLDFSEVFQRADEGGFEDSLSYFNIPKYHIKPIKKTPMQKILLTYLNSIKAYYMIKDKIFHTKNYSKIMYKKENKIQPRLNKHGLYSFRLGYYDFKNSNIKNKCFYGTFESCTPEYFEEAIKIMQKKVPKAKFFIFSDDVEWCKKNMKFPKDTKFETGTDPVWEKLRMMYSCKHFIISNSTFSWWAQYLSRNKEKIVIAPDRWTNDSYKEHNKIDIYEEDWELIKIK